MNSVWGTGFLGRRNKSKQPEEERARICSRKSKEASQCGWNQSRGKVMEIRQGS